MDAIRKKMQQMRTDTDALLERADRLEREASEANRKADQHDAEIRDLQKKIGSIEAKYDEAMEKLISATQRDEEKEKEWKLAEEDVNNLNRRMLLVEEENKRRDTDLAHITMELCNISRDADASARKVKILQSKSLTDEVLLEGLDKDVKEALFMSEDGDKKFVEISRRLGVMEEELKRALERAALADDRIISLEDQLQAIGENMIQLEISEEKALTREEKYKEQVRALIARLKEAEKRAEYGEMTITKLNIRIDEIEDEIIREKLKIRGLSDEVNDTFEDMMARY